MKTTLELPDDLMRRVRLRALRRGSRFKDEIAQLLETGLAHSPGTSPPRRAPKPVRLRGRAPGARDLERAIRSGRA